MKTGVTMKRVGESWRQAAAAGTLDLARKRGLAQELKAAVGPAPARSYLVNVLGENPDIAQALLADSQPATKTSSAKITPAPPSQTEKQRIADREVDAAIAARQARSAELRQKIDNEIEEISASKQAIAEKIGPLIERWSTSSEPFLRLCACVLRLNGRFNPSLITAEDITAMKTYGKAASLQEFFSAVTEKTIDGRVIIEDLIKGEFVDDVFVAGGRLRLRMDNK